MFSFTFLSLSFFAAAVFAVPLTVGDGGKKLAELYSHCTTPNTVALTFDDGPWIYVYDIVNQLDAAGVKGTFFFNGNNWDCIYNKNATNIVQYAYNKGHMIGSHTWAHKDLTNLTWHQLHDEIVRVDQALIRIIGVLPAFIRPPYRAFNDWVREIAADRGQSLVTWDFDSLDGDGASAATSESLYDEVIQQHPDTILALNHATYNTTADEVLPYAISKLKRAGYNLVTVAECLGLSPYQSVDKPQEPQPDWKC